MHSEHLDYYMPPPATFGLGRAGILGGRPPCNTGMEIGLAIASIAMSAASAAISYDSSQKQAKQVELNAEAQNQALKAEQDRQAAEFAENQRRALGVHKRQRAQQMAALASTGVMMTSGTPLALLSDTWQTQNTQLADEGYLQGMTQRELQYRRTSALAMGRNEAANIRLQGIGTALGQLGQAASQAYGAFGTKPDTATANASKIPAGAKIHNVSERPAGLTYA